jgi:hypothetical protein
LGAEIGKNKGNPFHPPLFLQATKMWRNEAWDWFRRNHDLAEWSPSRRLSAAQRLHTCYAKFEQYLFFIVKI